MKTLLPLLILFVSLTASAQIPVFEFDSLDADSLKKIESQFISAVDDRPGEICAFPEKTESVIERWQTLHQAFISHLKQNEFDLASDTKFFIRYYFNKDGSVRFVGYRILQETEPGFSEKFKSQLSLFASTFNFGLTADRHYAQCGKVTYPKIQ